MNPMLDLLSHLETLESRLLTWGVVDGGFTEDELVAHAVQLGIADPEGVLEAMLEQALLFAVRDQVGRVRYRTRMAETVRLLSRLRQWFPGKDWRIAPTLVADFRFVARQRLYPRRHLRPADLLQDLSDRLDLTEAHVQALKTLLTAPDRAILLARFQASAVATMLEDLRARESRAMIVCAGTGTGKTLAFYLPALAHLVSLVATEASAWTKGIAIYPRKELLKDQLSETYGELRRLDPTMARLGRRKLMLGAFFGPTPRRATSNDLMRKGWKRRTEGFECPFMSCPDCQGTLYWQHESLERHEEQLACTCGRVLGSDEIVLTRERMASSPPDLVFTTTEMLNRSMSDATFGRAFGLRCERPPHLLLLDEVHTYVGTSGAHVAHLLRRYQHAIAKPLHVTGLSATLEDAAAFFASLTGLPSGAVRAIEASDDLVAEGMEYLIALRGDPVSGTSLLSTTIQALMLMRRCLDPAGEAALSGGAYPSRLFAFTDDLDVTNRLFHNLLDAEGRDSFGQPNRGLPLADLRQNGRDDAAERMAFGQSWHLCETIGHDLRHPLEIDRTSSQDQGVASDADIVVATASLEVGYNDPNVGAVLQHKAPRDMAAFLQRKGRAGRRRTARPWTVVVLSDYGRDRLAYQGYDQLFSPRIEARSLPIQNRYILRIQAVFATMDWLGQALDRIGHGSAWKDFAGPHGEHGGSPRQREAAQLIRDVLDRSDRQEALERHLMASLRLSQEDVSALMWDPPRSLMTGALPTLLRRLESGWKVLNASTGGFASDPSQGWNPLPDFVPPNFFSDLLLPEVQIGTPAQTRHDEGRTDFMPILQAMRTFAPGRVSRRFGIRHGRASHWIPPAQLIRGPQDLPLGRYVREHSELGTFHYLEGSRVQPIRCVRPWRIEPEQIPTEILDTSNAWLEWKTQIVPHHVGLRLELPEGSVWRAWISEILAYSHHLHAPVEVRRFAVASRATIRRKQGPTIEEGTTTLHFRDDGPVAVGFTQDVDALVFRLTIPPLSQLCSGSVRKLHALRTARFRDQVLGDFRLADDTNEFLRDWLQQIFLGVLSARAMQDGCDLETALKVLRSEGLGTHLSDALETLFQTLTVEESEGGAVVRQRVHETLRQRCENPGVQTVLSEAATVLWSSPDPTWSDWLTARFKSTVGGALLEACRQLVPQMDGGDLVLDLEPGPRPPDLPEITEGLTEVWLSETTLGGGGILEEVVRIFSADPARFFRLVEAALEPGDLETIDSQLTRVLRLLVHETEVATHAAEVRSASDHGSLMNAHEGLRACLMRHGINLIHPVQAALQARILRPGSSMALDGLLHELSRRWQDEETRLGIEIDARTFAFVVSRDRQVATALASAGRDADDATWRFQALSGLLWPRGCQVRSRVLTGTNPFAKLPGPDRDLVTDLLMPHLHRVPLDDIDWRDQVESLLVEGQTVRLWAAPDQTARLREALVSLARQPVEAGYLLSFVRLEGLSVDVDGVQAALRLEEGKLT